MSLYRSITIVGVLVCLAQSSAAQTAVLGANAAAGIGGTTGTIEGAGNGVNLAFDTSSIPTGVPDAWGPTTYGFTVGAGAATGGAVYYVSDVVAGVTTGFRTCFDFYVLSSNIANSSLINIATAKAVSAYAVEDPRTPTVWRQYLARKSNGDYRFQFAVDEIGGGETVHEWGTNVSLQTTYNLCATYDLVNDGYLWTINGVNIATGALTSAHYQAVEHLTVGSSGSSTGRDITFFIDRIEQRPLGVTPASLKVNELSWSVYANPADDASITTASAYLGNTAGKVAALTRVSNAGADHHFEKIKWSDVEATVGNYTWTRIDTLVDNTTQPIILNIAPVWDDGTKTVPASLAAVAWDHADMTTAYKNMLTALASHVDQRLWILAVGDEADVYFAANPSDVTAYGSFLNTIRTHARTVYGTNPFAVTVTFRSTAASTVMDSYSAITNVTDVESFTYYPTVTDNPSTLVGAIVSDLGTLAGVIGPKNPFILQEIGITTSGISSEAQQQVAVSTAVARLSQIADVHRSLRAVTWMQLSDISSAVLTSFGYSSGDLTAGNGLRDTSNVAKDAWPILVDNLGGVTGDIPNPPACTFTLTPSTAAHGASAGAGSIALDTQAGCAWTLNYVDGTPAYFSPSATTGTGDATITYTLTANTSTAGRSFAFTIGDATFTLTQEGAVLPPPPPPACTYTLAATLDSFTSSAGNDTVDVTPNGSGCTWDALELDGGYSWLSLSPANGTGNGTITYTVLANTGTAARTARFSVGKIINSVFAGSIFTITQAGVTVPPDPVDPVFAACTSTTNSPVGYNPKMNWTPCRQDTWNRMYADYLANPAAPATRGGRLMKYYITYGNKPASQIYPSNWQHQTWLYHATGDEAWAVKAATNILARIAAITPACYHYYEPYTMVWALEWLRPYLTTTQEETIINHVANDCYPESWVSNVRTDDSDLSLPDTYFPVVLLYLTNPDNVTAAARFNHAKVGGLAKTAEPETFTFLDTAAQGNTMRNAAYVYFKKLAVGGEYIESGTQYNAASLSGVLMGYDAMKTVTGVDYMPEITEWVTGWAKAMMAKVTPDARFQFSWGDTQDPHGDYVRFPDLFRWAHGAYTGSGLLRGTKVGRALYGALLDVERRHGAGAPGGLLEACCQVHIGHAVLHDPYDTADPNWQELIKHNNNPGAGITLSRSSTTTTASLLQTQFAGPGYMFVKDSLLKHHIVDHYGFWNGNWELFRNGTWAITHPHAYGGIPNWSDGHNGPIMHSHGAMLFNDGRHVIQNDNYTYVTGTTGGSLVWWGARGTNVGVPVNEWTRGIIWLPTPTVGGIDTVILADRYNLPETVPALTTNYGVGFLGPYGYQTGFNYLASKSPTIFQLHTWTEPTKAGNTFSWLTEGKEAAKMTTLFPATYTHEINNETTLASLPSEPGWLHVACGNVPWGDSRCGGLHELKYHIKLWPTTFTQFGTMLNVVQIGGDGTITALEDAGKLRGVHLTRTGQSDVVAVFNAANGGTLTPNWLSSPEHLAQLQAIRYNGQGGTITWTASAAASTLVLLQDLHPGVAWTLNLDGSGAAAITPDAGGHYSVTVSGAGSHTIVLVGAGNAPPPDPSLCPGLTLSGDFDDGADGTVYSDSVTASGGTAPYVYTLASGSLPPGLTLATNGTLSGTPTSPGTYIFTVRATAADDCFVSESYTVVITAPVVVGIARTGTAQVFANVSGSVNTLSVSATMGTGVNRLGVVHVIGSTTDALTSCTYGGSAMTLITKVRQPNDMYLYSLRLINPSTGANTLTCTFSVNTVIAMVFHGYVGVHQTTPISTTLTGSATTTISSSSTAVIQAQVTPLEANTWTVLATRSWYVASPGLNATTVLSSANVGIAAFDFGPWATTPSTKTMEATFAGAGPVGAVMFAMNPAE